MVDFFPRTIEPYMVTTKKMLLNISLDQAPCNNTKWDLGWMGTKPNRVYFYSLKLNKLVTASWCWMDSPLQTYQSRQMNRNGWWMGPNRIWTLTISSHQDKRSIDWTLPNIFASSFDKCYITSQNPYSKSAYSNWLKIGLVYFS